MRHADPGILRPGILKSRDYFNSLIKAEIEKGIPSSRIVLGMNNPASTSLEPQH